MWNVANDCKYKIFSLRVTNKNLNISHCICEFTSYNFLQLNQYYIRYWLLIMPKNIFCFAIEMGICVCVNWFPRPIIRIDLVILLFIYQRRAKSNTNMIPIYMYNKVSNIRNWKSAFCVPYNWLANMFTLTDA